MSQVLVQKSFLVGGLLIRCVQSFQIGRDSTRIVRIEQIKTDFLAYQKRVQVAHNPQKSYS